MIWCISRFNYHRNEKAEKRFKKNINRFENLSTEISRRIYNEEMSRIMVTRSILPEQNIVITAPFSYHTFKYYW